jgi:hypothetical protein
MSSEPFSILLMYHRRSSVWIGAPIFHSAFHTAFLSALLDLDQERLYFIPHSFPPSLSAMLSIDGLLTWIGASWPGFAPPNFIPHSSITIITPLAHLALHIRHSFPGGTPLFPANLSYCLSNSILILCELTSQFQPFRYHKSSRTTLELNFAHSPDPNHSEIQGAPPASLRR